MKLYFPSPAHEHRFLTFLQEKKKIHPSGIDQDYGPAFYLLTSHEGLWDRVQPYIEWQGNNAFFQFQEMGKQEYLSSSERLIVEMADNLFTHHGSVNLVEFRLFDEDNIHLVFGALMMSYSAIDPRTIFSSIHLT